MGQALDRPWVDAGGVVSFAQKPVVAGTVSWPNELSITIVGGERQIAGNGLPAHVTGGYPAPSSSEAYQFDSNPNSISAQNVSYTLPVEPQLAAQPTCLGGGAIGIALSGGAIFNALDADDRDAVANEVFDLCEGHPQQQGLYHYHHASPCFSSGSAGAHSPLVGYALDGFGIYGPRGEGGVVTTNAALDLCHGHTGATPELAGEVYHYHLNEEFPYSLGCFRGTPLQSSAPAGGPPSGGGPPPPR